MASVNRSRVDGRVSELAPGVGEWILARDDAEQLGQRLLPAPVVERDKSIESVVAGQGCDL